MKPIDLITARLDRPRMARNGQWSARCPAHQDKGPSLSLREKPCGMVLIHCHAGCHPADILAAIGLTWKDLFPRGRPIIQHRNRATLRISHEAIFSVAQKQASFFPTSAERSDAIAHLPMPSNEEWLAAYDRRARELYSD